MSQDVGIGMSTSIVLITGIPVDSLISVGVLKRIGIGKTSDCSGCFTQAPVKTIGIDIVLDSITKYPVFLG